MDQIFVHRKDLNNDFGSSFDRIADTTDIKCLHLRWLCNLIYCIDSYSAAALDRVDLTSRDIAGENYIYTRIILLN